MKELREGDLESGEKPKITERLGLKRKPKKAAPATESLRGWAKSAVRSRSKA